jgi:hypothetical protein
VARYHSARVSAKTHRSAATALRGHATSLVAGVRPLDRTPAEVARRLRALLDGGARLMPAGRARRDPAILSTRRYLPRHEIALFDATYFLSDLAYDDALSFFVGYVVLGERSGRAVKRVWPRIFYKDLSLVWRVASHMVRDDDEYWIGKGEVRVRRAGGYVYSVTAEETTNLPYELQAAFDLASRQHRRRRDDDATALVLRHAPSGRLRPYADFTTPRRRAVARGRVNGGRPVARFLRDGDPASLRFAKGFAPDFDRGVIDESRSRSDFFGGPVRKLRILSQNGQIQYQFVAAPEHVWINPPQTLTTELSSYGVRTLDVLAPDDLCIPAFEYHDDGDEENGIDGHSQIPEGYAGDPHPEGGGRADASAWIEALPPVQAFRRRVLRRRLR